MNMRNQKQAIAALVVPVIIVLLLMIIEIVRHDRCKNVILTCANFWELVNYDDEEEFNRAFRIGRQSFTSYWKF